MFAFSGEHIFAQSMVQICRTQVVVGTRHIHRVRHTYRNDAHKSRGKAEHLSTSMYNVHTTIYLLHTSSRAPQQYELHIYLDFVRLGLGRITSSYVTRTRRAQARNPKLVLLIKTQVAVLFTTCIVSKQTTKTSSFSNLGKSELHCKIGNGQWVIISFYFQVMT